MVSSGSSTTWLSLFEDKKQTINDSLGPGYGLPGAVCNGRSFRTALEDIDRKKRIHKAPRLEAKLLPTYKSITDLSRAVRLSVVDLQDLPPNDDLEALGGWKAGVDLNSLATLVAELNKKVPSFLPHGSKEIKYPHDRRVQKPLQDVYNLFIDSHIFIFAHLTNQGGVEDEVLKSHISEKASQFESVRGTYDLMVNQAADDEARRAAEREQPGLDAQRSLPDILHENSNSTREIHANFVSVRPLGSGSFGDVDEVRELSTGASYARKHIHIDGSRAKEAIAEEVKNEVAVMQKLRHLHIATVLFYLKEETAYSIFMLPLADCNLSEFMSSCSKKDYPAGLTKLIYPWFGCLLDALDYAHRLKIKHQDIKPSNILIKNNQPYLSDFGLAKDFAELDNSASESRKVRGSLAYRAPEVQPHSKRGRKADVFSLGCVYSEMVTVCQGKSVEEYRQVRLDAGSTAFCKCLPTVEKWLKDLEGNHLSELLIDEILGMICSEADDRHTADTALKFLKRERAFFCVEQ